MQPPPLGNASAADFTDSFLNDSVSLAADVGDLSGVTRNLKGATDMMNEDSGSEEAVKDRRRRLLLGDRRALAEVSKSAATRDRLMRTLGGASESMQHTDNVITQQSDTVNGVSSYPEEMSGSSLSGGTGLVDNLVSSSKVRTLAVASVAPPCSLGWWYT